MGQSNPFPTINPQQLHPYGSIKRTHGHRGDLVISVLNEELFQLDPQFLFALVDGIPIPLEIEEMKGSKEQLIVTFSRIENMDEAEKWVGKELLIHEEEIPEDQELSETSRLLGFHVLHPTLGSVGSIVHLDDSTSNLLLSVEHPDGKLLLIPLVDDWITDVNSDQREITLDFPPELLEL